MKINKGVSTEASPPYNEIYHAYEPLFLSLFQQRLVYHDTGDSSGYVPIPEIETSLNNFVQSQSSEICLLVGPIGIGKSSVLRYLKSQWDSTPRIETLLLDLNSRNTTMIPVPITENLVTMDANNQKHVARTQINSFVAAMIESRISTKINFVTETDSLYDFFATNNRELLMPSGFFPPSTTEEKIAHLVRVQSNTRLAFLFVCLKYYALTRSLTNLIIIVDNCDQKDPLLIESFIDTLCHLDRCFDNITGDYDHLPCLTSIVSCRPPTWYTLQQNAPRNAMGSHGYHSVNISKPCALAPLLKQRIAACGNELYTSVKHIKIASRNGIIWQVERHEQFLNKLCESLELHGHGAMLLALCNNNLADSLNSLVDILRNRHFIDLDGVIGDVAIAEGEPEIGFPRIDLMRALAYGNPIFDPLYPVTGTIIPNLLSGDQSSFPRTFLKPRLLQMFIMAGDIGKRYWSLRSILDLCKTYFGKSDQDTLAVLDDLFFQKLIDTNRLYPPSEHGGEAEIAATSRAEFLWRELGESDTLLRFYRDDINLTERHLYQNVPTYGLDLRAKCSEILGLCNDSVEGELRELALVAERGNLSELMRLSGSELISDVILRGVGVSLQTFYRKYIHNWSNYDFEAQYRSIKDSLNAGRAKLNVE